MTLIKLTDTSDSKFKKNGKPWFGTQVKLEHLHYHTCFLKWKNVQYIKQMGFVMRKWKRSRFKIHNIIGYLYPLEQSSVIQCL